MQCIPRVFLKHEFYNTWLNLTHKIFFFKIIVGCPERLDHIQRGSALSKTPPWASLFFLLKAKVFCQIIYVLSVTEGPVSKRQLGTYSGCLWGCVGLFWGATPARKGWSLCLVPPPTFVEEARKWCDYPGPLKVMDVLIFAFVHMSASCRVKCFLCP